MEVKEVVEEDTTDRVSWQMRNDATTKEKTGERR